MDKAERDLIVGDVVQIDPEHDERFGGCFMIVTEPKSFGAQGAVLGPMANNLGNTGVAYYRCALEHMEYIGHAAWALEDEEER